MSPGYFSVNSAQSARKSRKVEKKWGDFVDLENRAYDFSYTPAVCVTKWSPSIPHSRRSQISSKQCENGPN